MMTTTNFTVALVLAGLTTGCATSGSRVQSAAGEVAPVLVTTVDVTSRIPSDDDALMAYTDASMELSERVRILDERASAIDNMALSLEEIVLGQGAFRDVTNKVWSQMERWSDGATLAKLRMVPTSDRADTEEFYFDQGRLVFVYWNPNGMNRPEMADDRPAESFYFGQEGLISAIRSDGARVEPGSAEFSYWDEHLRKEARRFSKGIGR